MKKRPAWLKTVLRSLIVCAIAALIDTLLAFTPLYNELAGAAFAVEQGRLQSAHSEPDPSLVVLDLASLIAPRAGAANGAPLPEESANQLAPQWDGLGLCLDKISKAKPKAVLIDWQLGLGKDFVDEKSAAFQYSSRVPQETRDSYNQLMETIHRVGNVYFVADEANERIKAGHAGFPVEGVQESAIQASQFPSVIGPYAALAPIEGEHGLPLATSSHLLEKWGWDDHLEHAKTKGFGLFHAEGEMSHFEGFWIDLAYAPSLITNSMALRFSDLDKSEVLSQLTGKVVVLADVQSALRWDTFVAPIGKNVMRKTLTGTEEVTRPGGGILTASALLTRKNGMLYASKEGISEWALVFLVSVVILTISTTLGHIRTKGSHDHQHEIERLSIELILMVLSVAFVLLAVWATPWTRVLLVGFPVWITTRMVDLSYTFVTLRLHLRNHSHHDKVHEK